MGKYVIAHPVVHEIVVEKSRFICTLARVETEGQAQEFVKGLKKKYWDASHNCSAYIIGPNHRVERSSDDGEPSGTAGSPMLEVLRRKELYDTAAVVTRYFGGIKLGAGGLTRTYAKCVTLAVDDAGLAQQVPMGEYVFLWNINDVGRVLNQLYQQTLFTVGDVEYETRARIHVLMQAADKEKAKAWLTEALSKKVELEQIREYFEEKELC